MPRKRQGILTLMSIARIIREARQRRRMSQTELGKLVGVTRASVNDWEKGRTAPSRKHAPVVAKVLNIPLSLIAGDPQGANIAFLGDEAKSRWVPLINWVAAGRGAEAVDPYPVGQGVEYLQVSGEYSDSTFALEVRGESMEPDFRQGDIIIIDPMAAPKSGDFVVVELLSGNVPIGQGPVTFKQYFPRGHAQNGRAAYDLIALNPDEQTITVNRANPGRIVGRMVEHRKRY
jgi:SOS-response transcriptional repressor LexA